MLTAEQKIATLETAIEKLHEANSIMQTALGASDECFDLHCGIESMADDLQAEIDTLRALHMQGIIE